MDPSLTRRSLVAAGLALPLLALPGCATRLGDVPGLDQAIRRLLTLASQRALARLLVREGYFADEAARVNLPSQMGGDAFGRALAVLLGARFVQDRLLRLVNEAAAEGARAAAPVVYEGIRDMSLADARAILRGGPTAATDRLQAEVGDRIFEAMFPGVGEVLRIADNGLVQRALRITTGIDFRGLQADVTRKAAAGLYRAIGREEAAIRADPSAAGDPLLAEAFGRRR
ncbi:MAG: hypothetical protein QOJ27_2293 [Sphingomonadales bacterium]|nr:hypothetical protein [Sphingomonadales bacterium]